MKRKHKRKLRSLRLAVNNLWTRHLELLHRHETMCRSLSKTIDQLKTDRDHLNEALQQRGVWDHDYSAERKPKTVQ